MLLAGDIGGTKTRIGIYSFDRSVKTPLIAETFFNAAYPDFTLLLQEFLQPVDMKFERAVFGVAGPLMGDRVSMTNLPWEIDSNQLKNLLQIPSVKLLNDLEALGYALPLLDPADILTLNSGSTDAEGNIAVIAPGTGLGEVFLTKNGKEYQPHATEGGHADFAPADALQIRLLQHLLNHFDHVSYEKVCSGPGIYNIYAFLKESGQMEAPEWLTAKLSDADDPVPAIIDAAVNEGQNCSIGITALNIFLSILGAEAGNFALKVKATGGVYLGGGIPPRIVSALQNGKFMEAFKQKGGMTHLLERIPVHVILNSDAVLMGAAQYGLKS